MKPLSAFYPRIAPYLMGCPEPLMAQALVDYAIAFCEDSMALRRRLDTFMTQQGVVDYALDADTEQQVARVFGVAVDGAGVAVGPLDLSVLATDTQGRPSMAYPSRVDGEFLLMLAPVPDAAYPVVVDVAVRPTREAKNLPDDLFDLWVEPISLGTIGTLAQMPGQPFSDAGLGVAMSTRALQLSRKARIEGGIGRVRATSRVAQRPFA